MMRLYILKCYFNVTHAVFSVLFSLGFISGKLTFYNPPNREGDKEGGDLMGMGLLKGICRDTIFGSFFADSAVISGY